MTQAKLVTVPITIKAAAKFVRQHHRHLPSVTGGLFAVAVAREGETDICGVAIVGRPSRMAQDGWTCVVTRCATDGTPNACSFLYALCRRVGQLMGYRKVQTFTRDDEPGTSLFAAAAQTDGETDGGSWSRENRKRDSVNTGRKTRWKI